MTRHNPIVCLRHMLDHASEAAAMAHDRRREDLDRDRQLNLSLVRLLEIVGEAASRIDPPVRQQYAGVPWADIIGLRHRLAHGYDAVNFDILWTIVKQDLPPLIARLQDILREV